MPASIRSKGYVGGNKSTPGTPMSERQQMALLMQMTSKYNDTDNRNNATGESTSLRSKDRNERGETHLHVAAIRGDIEHVSRLLNSQADPNVTDFAGWTPLHEACNHGWHEVACRLIQAGANVNAKGLDNFTPLHDAVQNGHIKLVKLLVEKGADIHAKNTKGNSPLDCASPEIAAVLKNPSLVIPESSVSTRLQPRSRDEKKVTESPSTSTTNKQKTVTPPEETMDTSKTNSADDVYEFKTIKESSNNSPENKTTDDADAENDGDSSNANAQSTEEIGTAATSSKRTFSEVSETNEDSTNDEDSKRKKRKDDNPKETKTAAPQRNVGQGKGQSNKQTSSSQNKTNANTSAKSSAADTNKSPTLSPKPATSSDAELEDGKSDLKVPPLKIVIPQSSNSEQEMGSNRNGKSSSQRSHQALPYVVPSSNNENSDKDATTTGTNSPTDNTNIKNEEKKENTSGGDDQRSGHHQRVLRSSHRSGNVQGSADRSSNNSSPQLQRSHSPSPSASPSTPSSNQPETSTSTIHNNSTALSTSKSSDVQATTTNNSEQSTPSSNIASSSSSSTSAVELHPRKRKMKPNKEPPPPPPAESPEMSPVNEIHPHEQPITNCYQLYLNIRRQIEKRRRGLFLVHPKPPQGYKNYLTCTCSYLLAGRAPTTPNITYPATLPTQMMDLFQEQEKERYRLRMQHVVEKEKLVLSVEKEIIRVHARAARSLANQSLPFSVCTILKDEEVYNLITPEEEEKDRNARSRYNGRLFLSWLQDVDDKWEKIKEHMLLRHHNEAESLHAVQKMDWEWKMKELSLCDAKTTPQIDDLHVPMVYVSDDFDLLPA